jgi:hypothetical protein
MVYKRSRFGPSDEEQEVMKQDPETNQASAALWSIYYGSWSKAGQGYVSLNKLMPSPSVVDMVAMPVLLFGVALFFLLK